MKGRTEPLVAAAIRKTGAYAYKPPDDARNRKPCDYFVWMPDDVSLFNGGVETIARSTWVEVKDVPGETMPADYIRSSQRAGIALAMRLDIPYWLVIWWRKHECWSAVLASNPVRPSLWHQQLTLMGSDIGAGGDATLDDIIRGVLG